MYSTLATLVDRLEQPSMKMADVLQWCSPVPVFGNVLSARVATLGLNPSNREFVDDVGNELDGLARRFHTLHSLGLPSWGEADSRHLRLIQESCFDYFTGNPYDRWFGVLDRLLASAHATYYGAAANACHLDLIPYATGNKWMDLASAQRHALLRSCSDTLGILMRDSQIDLLILNGRTVVDQFSDMAEVMLEAKQMDTWALNRSSGPDVRGIGYVGYVQQIADIDLGRQVLVLGYNHNLQSSFGVSSRVMGAISEWIGAEAEAKNY